MVTKKSVKKTKMKPMVKAVLQSLDIKIPMELSGLRKNEPEIESKKDPILVSKVPTVVTAENPDGYGHGTERDAAREERRRKKLEENEELRRRRDQANSGQFSTLKPVEQFPVVKPASQIPRYRSAPESFGSEAIAIELGEIKFGLLRLESRMLQISEPVREKIKAQISAEYTRRVNEELMKNSEYKDLSAKLNSMANNALESLKPFPDGYIPVHIATDIGAVIFKPKPTIGK